MHDLGIDDLVLVGACFSARTALSAAPSIRGVRAVVMATPPVGGYGREDAMAERLSREWSWSDYVRRAARLETLTNLVRPSHRQAYTRFARFKLRGAAPTQGGDPTLRWVSPKLLAPLETMVERGIPVLVVYGDKDPLLGEWGGPKPDGSGPFSRAQATWSMWWTTSLGWCTASLGSASDRFLALAVDWIRAKVPTRPPGPMVRTAAVATDHGDEIRPQASPKKPGSTVTVSACSISHQPRRAGGVQPAPRRDAAQLPARCC